MARISTGDNYGGVTRQTPQRLLGGMGNPSMEGSLALRPINAPAISPQANPVETFVNIGQGPTLGGPVSVPRPPDVPAPNGDMERLAQALGNFSPMLAKVGDAYIENRKRLDEQRKIEGQQFAQYAANRVGAYTGIADAQRKLEKRAAEGDEYAGRLLKYMLSRHPGMYAYLEEAAQETAILTGTANLSRVVRNDPEIPDGQGGMVKLGALEPDDPRVTGFFQQQIISDRVVSPRVYAKYQNLIVNSQNQAREVQEGLAIQRRVEDFKAEHAAQIQGLADVYSEGTVSSKAVTASLQSILDDQRFLGLPKKEQDGIIDGLWNQWRAAVLFAPGAAQNPPTADTVLAPFMGLFVGPVEERMNPADGTPNEKLRLVSRLGGTEWQSRAYAQVNADWLQRYNQAESIGQVEAQNFAAGLFSQDVTPEITRNPDLARSARERNLQQIQERYANDPIKLAKATAVYDQLWTTADTAYNGEARRNLELQYSFELAQARQNPEKNVEMQRKLKEDVAAGRVSDNFAQSTIGTLASFLDASSKPYDEQLSSLIRARQDEWAKLSKDPRSYDGQSVGEYESNAWARAESGMLQEGQKIINEGLAAGKSRLQINKDLEDLFKSRNWGLKPREIPAAQTRLYSNPQELIQRNTGWMSRGNIPPEKANNLKAQARVRPLLDEAPLLKELDAITSGKPLGPEMKAIMRALMTGPNKLTPSEFFTKQLRFYGIDVSPEDMQKIKALDGSLQVSRAPAPPRPVLPAAQNPAIAALRNVGGQALNASLNVVVPPAAAAGIPMGMASRGAARSGSTSLLAVIRDLRGANQFRGVKLIKNKRRGDYQSDPQENWFFDFNPSIVPKALARAKKLTEQDINALAFTALTEAGPTTRGKLEVAANLINRSAIAGNKPIVDIAKAPEQYAGVFGYSRSQVVSAAEGRRIFGRRYDQVRKLITQGI